MENLYKRMMDKVGPKNKGVGINENTELSTKIITQDGTEVDAIFLDGKTIIPPDKATKVLTEIINTEFSNYVEKAFKGTCDNIDSTLDVYMTRLEKHNGDKITQITNKLMGNMKENDIKNLVINMIEVKVSNLIEEKVNELISDGRVNSLVNDFLKKIDINVKEN